MTTSLGTATKPDPTGLHQHVCSTQPATQGQHAAPAWAGSNGKQYSHAKLALQQNNSTAVRRYSNARVYVHFPNKRALQLETCLSPHTAVHQPLHCPMHHNGPARVTRSGAPLYKGRVPVLPPTPAPWRRTFQALHSARQHVFKMGRCVSWFAVRQALLHWLEGWAQIRRQCSARILVACGHDARKSVPGAAVTGQCTTSMPLSLMPKAFVILCKLLKPITMRV